MFRCERCGTGYVDPVPTDEFLEEFYSSYHLSAEMGGTYVDVEARMEADFPTKVAMAKRFAPMSGTIRLLDVGCGKGYFARAALDAGIEAEGCDLSDNGVKHAVEKLGVKACAGHIAELKHSIGLEKFDVVTFWATVEHLPDPISVMRDLRDVLKPGGVLLMDTGIGNDWLDRLMPGRVQWFDPPQHLFVFSGQGLELAVEKAGFKVVHHDLCFERSDARRILRNIRNGLTAAILRLGSELGRLKHNPFESTRFPMGNLQSIVARKV
jgi:SAM-dependent methyltransferase